MGFIATLIVLWISVIHAIHYVNQDIQCTDNECIIECSHHRSCALSSIHCNNATRCRITCNAQEACASATIYHTSSNQHIEINCMDLQSCASIQIKHEPNTTIIPAANNSLTFNSLSKSASPRASVLFDADIATFRDVNIHCAAESSCTAMMIALNHATNITIHNLSDNLHFNMNIYCSGVQSCTNMQLDVDANWQHIHQISVQWDAFIISLHCNNSQSCQYAAINTEKLQINSHSSSSESFADFYLFCDDVDQSCLFMHILCPESVQFHAIYDYLYQTAKCHVSVTSSYQNHISIISKHGFRMIDMTCDDNDALICDGITLYCSEDPNSYFCSMQYDAINESWYCDNHDIYYVFTQNYSYGCDEFIWLDEVAIIETSKIPNYDNKATLSCLKYNPSTTLKECYMYCDSDYSCARDIRCDNSTKCHIECSGLQSCKDYNELTNYIYCPYNNIANSSCSLLINPSMLQSEFGGWYSIYMISVYNQSSIDLTISHNIGAYVYDYGMTSANVVILNSDDWTNWTVNDDVEALFRIINEADGKITTPLAINILCDRCYTDWVDVTQYRFDRNVSVYLSCVQCSGTEFDAFGIQSFQFDCLGDCTYSSIGFTDSSADINCYDMDSCTGMDIYLIPSNYSSYMHGKHEYNLKLLNTSTDISLYSQYGFNQLFINDVDNDTAYAMDFHCGYPDYYHAYDTYDDVNETKCLQSNPLYSSSVVGLFEWQYASQTITSETVYCFAYKSCHNADMYCTGTDCIIRCSGFISCRYSRIYTNYYIGNTKHKQNSLKVYCMDYWACMNVTIYGSDSDDIELHCTAGDSCYQMTIYHADAYNPSKGLTVTCYDKYKFATVLAADFIYHWPSCRSMGIYCPLVGCSIDLQASTYVDHYDINIYYAQGLNELNITCESNELTGQNTCYDVNYYCNLPVLPEDEHIHKNGNNATHYVYKSTFDDTTGQCIGECCGYIFSDAPTSSPSNAPSSAPTAAPTYSPTYSPTTSPTRYPTIFDFDGYFVSKFYITRHIATDIVPLKNFLNISNIKSDVEISMEYAYLSASTSWSYSEYMVMISNISHDRTMMRFNFTGKVFAESDVISHYAAYTKVNADFRAKVSEQLQIKWNLSNITFGIYSNSTFVHHATASDTTLNNEGQNATLIAFISFTTCIWIIGFLSFLHTNHKLSCMDNLPRVNPCDDEQYLNVIKYGAQSLDLFSDVVFCWELYVFSLALTDPTDITVIKVLYSFSFAFFLLPYSMNLIFAVIFEKFMDKQGEKLSDYTRNYFAKYSTLFAILVIVSGSISASLRLVNSSIFGLDAFHAGFTKYELINMSKFRVLFTVLSENVPQFLIQLVYVSYFGGRDEEVVTFIFVVSTFCSISSILSTIMAYVLQKKHISKYQTRFIIEIVSVRDAKEVHLDRGECDQDNPQFKIEVRDVEVRKLHKRCNLRKIMIGNIAKCLGKLSDNFELLYCVEQMDGLTFHGLCSSDNCDTLQKLFDKYEDALAQVVRKIYQLNRTGLIKYWEIKFVVFDVNKVNNKSIQLTKPSKENNGESDGKTVTVADHQYFD
eukprot:628_1